MRPVAKRTEDAGSPSASPKRAEDVGGSGASPKRSDTVLVPALGAEVPVSGAGASPKRSDTVLVPALNVESLLGSATAGPKRTDTVQVPALGDAAVSAGTASNKSKRSDAVRVPAPVRGAPPEDELPTAESVPPLPVDEAASVARSSGSAPPRGEPGRERPPSISGTRPSDGKSSSDSSEASNVARPASATASEDSAELARSQRMEAQLIAKRSWRELAQLYLKRAEFTKEPQARAEVLTRLAEVMETELKDPVGAARVYREIVELTGDRDALREQVRLLTQRGDASVVRRALDEAILNARTPRARASALLTRGERWLHLAELGKARRDFHAAEAIAPGVLPVLAGLVRCVADSERPTVAERLKQACIAAPRRTVDRLDALKVLASTAENVLGDLRLAQWAWAEALSESPESEQARERLVVLARRLGDLASLGHLLRAQLTRDPRGPAAREARLELVSTLESAGDSEGALTELRQAVRFEPGHKDAWLMLSDRLSARGQLGEAAWALENAATAMEDEEERERAWQRLAVFCREVLRNPERAEQYARRAENMRLAREASAPPPPEPPRSAIPKREPSGPRSVLVAPPATVSLTPAGSTDLSEETTSNTDFELEGVPGGANIRGPSSDNASAAKRPVRSAPSAPKDAPASKVEKDMAAPKQAKGAEDSNPPKPAAKPVAPAESAASKSASAPKSAAVEPAASKGAPASKPAAPAEPAASKSAPASKPAAPAEPAASKSAPASKPAAPAEPAASKSAPASKPAAPAEPAASKSAPASKPAAPAEPAASKSAPASKPAAPAEPAASKSAPASKPAAPAEPAASKSAPASKPAAPAEPAASKSAPASKPAAPAEPAASKSAPASKPAAPAEPAASKSAPASKPAAPAEPAASKSAPASKPAAPAEPAASKSAPASKPAAPAEPAASKSAPASKPAAPAEPAASKSAPASKPAAPAEPAASKGAPASKSAAPDSAAPKSAKGADAASSSAKGMKDAPAAPKAAPAEPPAAQNRGAKSRSLIDDGEDLRPDAINATQVIGWEAPPGRMDPVRRLHRPRSEGTVSGPAPSRPPEPVAKPLVGAAETREAVSIVEPEPATAEPAVFRLVREQPLDPKPYRGLVEHFESRGDVARAALMQETADALEGKEMPAPRGLRAPLSADERAGLRHPGLRTPSGELLACAGLALCRLFPTQGRTAGVTEPLRSASGPGAPAILDTLHTVARMMDVPLPELVLAEDDGPPFTVVYTTAPRLVVGREGVRQAMPVAELRFHAGRALFSLSPDLLALRTLKEMQLLRALALLSSVLKDPRATSDEARIVREALSPRALERAAALMDAGTRDFKASTLMDAARDSVNRAGLVACGGVGPALAALRARRVREPELTELLRFAASERYLALRSAPERSGR
ncbi:tetratricopeptide repeat protein [Myxococcaceae bacterium JPH2]|nr:tetratricopeptide repeat protein [Myxococcaceae bacterium JPH2]